LAKALFSIKIVDMDNNEIVNLNEDRDIELREIKDLTIENNRMLHAIQRRARWSMAWRIFYWIVITGIAFGSFIYLQPYLEKVTNTYNSLVTTQQKISNTTSSFSLDSFKSYFMGSSTSK